MNNTCPIPDRLTDKIELAHGGGGSMTATLIKSVFGPKFNNSILNRGLDSAILPQPDCHLAFTTDTFVVNPLFFPGGNIGDLAVNGTANDLLCSGATPRYLSVGFVIEEGFDIGSLHKIAQTMADAAKEAEMEIVTGDTKVVERGKADGVYINTSGIGYLPPSIDLNPNNLHPGDKIIVTGSIARHGMAVMSQREGLSFSSPITSDTASLGDIVHNLLDVCPASLRVLRDPTRGGLASTLNEFVEAAGVNIVINEESIPVQPAVRSACDLLGLDPLHVANEGIMVVAVAEKDADAALAAVRRSAHGGDAAIIGEVLPPDEKGANVWLTLPLGNRRKVEMLSGEQLPRIC
ncbi:MAG: hydrogenase expression/formation protein HypE [Paramuribaculum sp.]|nr:hydrogenase expression/formation protein HypE [Paramuribaculum sp.]